jgi:L-threonylcarbamoyladenylate synthase
LLAGDPESYRWAAGILQDGGLVAFPTDTVYGLGALIWNEASIIRIYAAKERPREKAIPILVSGVDEARRLVGELPPIAEALVHRFWPGPLTLVVPCGDRLPHGITSGTGTVALRAPRHLVTLRLLETIGQPLAVTSANRSGAADPLTAEDVLAQLGGRIDAVLDGGQCPGGRPSTVLSAAVEPPQVLRSGPIGLSELSEALRQAGFEVRVAN